MNNKYKTFEELKEDIGEGYENILYEMGIDAMEKIEYLQDELQRKDNIINELEKWLKDEENYNEETMFFQVVRKSDILDKIKELESKGNE